ncbi:NYN domain-containing protein [Clostridium sp. YIM B02505]|uniref:NYN domain-containing protein n=1 Tax=Clostridium yunnanense TaxID=2800325 RepID=A0ABS1ETF0_9CLOT|nr:NYN domain-containing protein [Clostridium yunnanense]
MRIIYIDGYNVINSWPNLNKIKDYSFESARQQLIDTMQNYGSYKSSKIVIVFDAHKVGGNMEKKDKLGMVTVVFTKDGETADAYIERMINNIGRKVEVFVVTSDWLEQQTIFQRGAVRMSSLEFYNEVLSIEDKIRKKTEKSKLKQKNLLEDSIDKKILEELEKIRRSR